MITSQTKGARFGFAALGAGLLLAAAPANAQTGYPSGVPAQDGPGEALSRNLRSLAENPKSLSALMGAGKAALQLGDPQAAITFFGRAEEQAPNDGRVKMWIAAALVQLQQPQGALKFFAEASRMGVPEAELAGERGLAFDLTGDSRRAQRDYRLALQRGPDAEVTRRLALSLAISGEREPALQLLEGQLLTRDRAAERSRAFILAMTGDSAGAVRAVQTSMPNGQGSALAPFLERMHALGPTERALAVHLGHFPQNWRNLPVARPIDSFASVASAVRSGPPAAARSAPGRRSSTPAAEPRPQQPAASRPVTTAAAKPAAPTPQPAKKAPAAAEPRREPAESRSQWAWSGRTPEPRTTRPRTETPKPAAPRQQIAAAAPTALAVTQPAPAQSAPQQSAPVQSAPLQSVSAQSTPVQTPVQQVAANATPLPGLNLPAVQAPQQVAATATPLPGLGQPIVEAPREEPVVAAAAPAAAESPAPVQIAEARPVLSAPGFSIAGPAAAETAVAAASPPPASAPEPAPAGSMSGSRLADVAATVAALSEVVLPAAAQPEPAPTPAAKAPAPAAKAPAKAAAPAAKAPAPAAKKPAAPAEPSRHWVQIAGGADKATFPREFARLKAKAPRLAAQTAWTTPLKATNRLLVGPFKSASEAQAFVNELAKADLSAFAWTSEAGQKIDKLPAR